MSDDDQQRRAELAKKIEATLSASAKSGVVDPAAVRATDPRLADVLDEFVLSKSYRTDPQTTAKQVAEVIVARDANSKLGQLIGSLKDELDK